MTTHRLLGLMADGAFHSGRELGEMLGISRSAVWKQIQRLQQLGLEVYSVKGRGYRLPDGIDLLDLERFQGLLSDTARTRFARIQFEPEVGSTNRLALEALKDGVGAGLFAAEYQSQGRGRRGRDWVSPYAANLCFSLAWRFSVGLAALEGLSLTVGLALRQALLRLGVGPIELKWPNDLLSEGRKLGGILIEVSGEAGGEAEVVIGIGLNVAMPDAAFEQVSQPCIDLSRLAAQRPSRTELLAVLVEELILMLDQFERQGFVGLREQWQQANAYRDRPIRLISGAHEVNGICRGVDASGALLLEAEGRIEAYHGGEVSVRAQ